MEKVTIESNKVVIPDSGKRSFAPNITLRDESIEKGIAFAAEMAYGEGYHKSLAFGGKDYDRGKKEIFINTLQGKIAELGFYNYMHKQGIKPDKEPDFGVWEKGKWEDCDFEFLKGKYKVSVKSTKRIGNLLLLEKDRYNKNGEYLEPAEGDKAVSHDFIFLARIEGVESGNPSDYVKPYSIKCEITGFITHETFKTLIQTEQLIKKGVLLGIPLIVDNYYVCASDLLQIDDFKKLIV